MKEITIAIADDHPIIVDGFKTILDLQEEFSVIGTASNGEEAIKVADSLNPNIFLLDVQMPVITGIEAAKIIKERHPDIRILMLTSNSNGQDVLEAIAHGATGFLLKDWPTEHIIDAIKGAMQDKIQLPSSASASILELLSKEKQGKSNVEPSIENLPSSITTREKEIAHLLANNYTNKEIASQLFLSVGTVKNYITTLYRKLGVETRKDAVALLKRN